mgnify:CR=1 FL=1
MKRDNTERHRPLTLVDPPLEGSADGATTEDSEALRRTELGLRTMAGELAEALMHLERATLVSKGTGFTARVRDAFEEVDRLQRSASEEFGRKVGDRMGRDALWRRRRGIDLD